MTSTILRTNFEKSVAAYWNTNQDDPVNLRLGEVDDLYHHHYGVGPYDPGVLDGPADTREQRIIAELHRLESAQADLLLDHLGPIGPDDLILDGGSGRGGTSIMAHQRFGCEVDGVSISEYQVGFANEQAARRGIGDRVLIMAGVPFKTSGSTNVIHVVKIIGDELETYSAEA